MNNKPSSIDNRDMVYYKELEQSIHFLREKIPEERVDVR